MNIPFFLFTLFALGIASLFLGKKTKKGTNTKEDYFLMNRSLPFLGLAMTLLATQVGGGSLMGAAEEAYTKGWSVIFYPLGMVLGLLVLGCGFGAKMRKLNLTTVAQIFEKKFNSKGLRQTASLLSVASLFFILVAQAIAAKKFFISLGFSGPYLFVIFWAILVVYTVIGGLKAVIKTDILQASFILLSFGIAMVASFGSATAPFDGALTSIATPTEGTPWITWLLMPLLFMLIEQDMGQRCFAAKTPKTVSLAAITAAGVLLLCSLVPIYFGTLAAKMGIAIEPGSSVLIASVLNLTHPLIASMLMGAIFMAIISTADSLLCSISSNLSCDFPWLQKGSEKVKLLVSQGITALVGLITLSMAFFFDNVVGMLMFSYEMAVSVLFVPVMMGLFLKRPHKLSAALAMSVGCLCFLLFKGVPPPLVPKEALTIILAALTFASTEMLLKKRLGQELTT